MIFDGVFSQVDGIFGILSIYDTPHDFLELSNYVFKIFLAQLGPKIRPTEIGLKEFDKTKILKCSLLLVELPRNRLDPPLSTSTNGMHACVPRSNSLELPHQIENPCR